jgi:hypothetical protein
MDVQKVVSDHPLIAAGLGLIFLVILLLGTLHSFRFFLRLLWVGVDEVKHEFRGIGKEARKLKGALTSGWKADP